MTAPHFFAPDVAGERIVLEGEDAGHAARVLRIRPGEQITVSDGRGEVVRATVIEAGSEVVAEVFDRCSEPKPVPGLHVYQAIPKTGKLDFAVQKLTEIGADSIHLFPAGRSVSRWDAAKAVTQTDRLASIAREAAKQSRRAWLPRIHRPVAIESLELPRQSFVLEAAAPARLRELLQADPPDEIGLIVGPEGGLTHDEIALLEGRGAKAASLGPLVMRTETAAFAAAAVVLVLYGRLG